MPASPNPDESPYVHGRDLVPIRRDNPRYTDKRREAIFEAEDALHDELRELDETLVQLTARRRHVLEAIEALHDQVRPRFMGARGRRPRAVSLEEPLPPIAARPLWLSGRTLRGVCLAYLRLAPEPLTLRQLHVILHRAGYAIASAVPAKALADALGLETTLGRARRVQRGVYTITKAPPPRWEPADPNLPPLDPARNGDDHYADRHTHWPDRSLTPEDIARLLERGQGDPSGNATGDGPPHDREPPELRAADAAGDADGEPVADESAPLDGGVPTSASGERHPMSAAAVEERDSTSSSPPGAIRGAPLDDATHQTRTDAERTDRSRSTLPDW